MPKLNVGSYFCYFVLMIIKCYFQIKSLTILLFFGITLKSASYDMSPAEQV